MKNEFIICSLITIIGLLAAIFFKLYGIHVSTSDVVVFCVIGAFLGALWAMPVLMGSLVVALLIGCPIALFTGVVWYVGLCMVVVLWSGLYEFADKRLKTTISN